MWKIRLALVVLPIVLSAGAWASESLSTPTRSTGTSPSPLHRGRHGEDPATINAVEVRSWSDCGTNVDELIWEELNARWSEFGSVPVHVDFDHAGLCDGPVTYEGLVESAADVVILSDPAGGVEQFSDDEIAAIRRYAEEGHNVVGSLLVFRYVKPDAQVDIDNRGLAPVFGLDPTLEYVNDGAEVDLTFRLRMVSNLPLFAGLDSPFRSEGYPYSQTPQDGFWDRNELLGARIVGANWDHRGAIVLYTAPTYTAVYLTTMPEYRGGTEDMHLYYNAIVLAADAELP